MNTGGQEVPNERLGVRKRGARAPHGARLVEQGGLLLKGEEHPPIIFETTESLEVKTIV
jgi:hypothetical protein